MITATQEPTTTHPITATPVGPSTAEVVAALPSERLEAEIVSVAQRLSAGTYELLVLVGELDARGTWVTFGALSCAAWLADVAGIEIATARTQVRVARAMRTHPELNTAMESGDLSYAKARVLVPHLTEKHAAELVALAFGVPAGALGAAIAAWSQRYEDPEDREQRHHQERSVSWRCDPDGMVTITARLAPAEAAKVCAVIDQKVIATRAPAGASLRQQRADALAATVTNGGADVTAEIVIHARGDANTLADGTPISDRAVTSLLPDGFVSLLVKDMNGRPVDASPRRRTPTRRQKRVLDERQPQCAHPGCTASAFLQYDHIQPYAQHGPTTIDNLQKLCGPHNRRRTSYSQNDSDDER